ncbi:MAG TPA: hypothetical protein VJ911_03745, partial [Cryomorphaceae bacterium]|nr:hypothetical protein [Cryomorphaceae bacterium]
NILEKHPKVQELCDNGWIFLLALDDGGKIKHRYGKNGEWETLDHAGVDEAVVREGMHVV